MAGWGIDNWEILLALTYLQIQSGMQLKTMRRLESAPNPYLPSHLEVKMTDQLDVFLGRQLPQFLPQCFLNEHALTSRLLRRGLQECS